MLFHLFVRVMGAVGLLAAVWALGTGTGPIPPVRIRPVGTPRGPVRILRFFASKGSLVAGQRAQLCYGVENAKSVRISPSIPNIYPAASRCLEIVPERTTHYTILAEGFDGNVATRFFTLVVQSAPAAPRERVNLAQALPVIRF